MLAAPTPGGVEAIVHQQERVGAIQSDSLRVGFVHYQTSRPSSCAVNSDVRDVVQQLVGCCPQDPLIAIHCTDVSFDASVTKRSGREQFREIIETSLRVHGLTIRISLDGTSWSLLCCSTAANLAVAKGYLIRRRITTPPYPKDVSGWEFIPTPARKDKPY